MKQHVVRRGESLSAIAHRYGLRSQDLVRINRLHDPDRLTVGQRLVVQSGPDAPVSAGGRASSVPAGRIAPAPAATPRARPARSVPAMRWPAR